MSTIIHNHTRPSDLFRPAGAVIALWEDVEAITNHQPYRLHTIAGIKTRCISDAKRRGYFSERLARRIHDATNYKLPLIPYEQTKSGQALKAKERRFIKG